MVYHMTKTHDFSPGDLVVAKVYKHGGSVEMVVAVKEPPHDRQTPAWDSPEYVYLDVPGDHPYHNQHHTKLKPAPILVGSWVRIFDNGSVYRAELIGKTFQVATVNDYTAYPTDTTMLPGMPGGAYFGCLRVITAPPQGAPATDLQLAQQLATTLANKHFPGTFTVATDLPTVLNQIDHMTANMVNRSTLQIAENARLDAIAERDEAHAAVVEAGKLLRVASSVTSGWFEKAEAWLAKCAPKHEFKRGDLVTWGCNRRQRRITGFDNDFAEVMTIDGPDAGSFTMVRVDDLRHVENDH